MGKCRFILAVRMQKSAHTEFFFCAQEDKNADLARACRAYERIRIQPSDSEFLCSVLLKHKVPDSLVVSAINGLIKNVYPKLLSFLEPLYILF